MANDIQRMVKEPVTTGLVFLIEDFVLFEETMMNNPKIKSNLQNTQFWVELADIVKADIYEALKEKTGFDVDIALKNMMADKAEDSTSSITPTSTRRVQPEAEATGRRTSGAKYNVVKKGE